MRPEASFAFLLVLDLQLQNVEAALESLEMMRYDFTKNKHNCHSKVVDARGGNNRPKAIHENLPLLI